MSLAGLTGPAVEMIYLASDVRLHPMDLVPDYGQPPDLAAQYTPRALLPALQLDSTQTRVVSAAAFELANNSALRCQTAHGMTHDPFWEDLPNYGFSANLGGGQCLVYSPTRPDPANLLRVWLTEDPSNNGHFRNVMNPVYFMAGGGITPTGGYGAYDSFGYQGSGLDANWPNGLALYVWADANGNAKRDVNEGVNNAVITIDGQDCYLTDFGVGVKPLAPGVHTAAYGGQTYQFTIQAGVPRQFEVVLNAAGNAVKEVRLDTQVISPEGVSSNHAPVTPDLINISAPVDMPTTVDVLAQCSDPDGDPVSLVTANTHLISGNGRVSMDGGKLIVTVTRVGSPPLVVGYTVTDGSLTADGTIVLTGVGGSNHAPVAPSFNASGPAERSSVIDVLARCSDPDGDPLRLAGAEVTSGNATATVQNGAIVVSPNSPGPITIAYTIADTPAEGSFFTASGVIYFTAESTVNQAPQASSFVSSGPAETSSVIDVSRWSSDPNRDPTHLIGAHVTSGNATAAVQNGLLVVTPGSPGPVTIDYTIADTPAVGEPLTATGAIYFVAVRTVNHAPTPTQLTVSGQVGKAIVVNIPTAGTDPDGDYVVLVNAAPANPAQCQVTRSGNTVKITPKAAGTYTVYYGLKDVPGGSLRPMAATGTITVTAVKPAPVVRDRQAPVLTGTGVTADANGNRTVSLQFADPSGVRFGANLQVLELVKVSYRQGRRIVTRTLWKRVLPPTTLGANGSLSLNFPADSISGATRLKITGVAIDGVGNRRSFNRLLAL